MVLKSAEIAYVIWVGTVSLAAVDGVDMLQCDEVW